MNIKNKDNRNFIKSKLSSALVSRTEEEFTNKLEEFLVACDSVAQKFKFCFISNYVTYINRFALFSRVESESNTNLRLEVLFRVLKYNFLTNKFQTRLDVLFKKLVEFTDYKGKQTIIPEKLLRYL